MDLELAGKVVLVAGGSRGIGLAIARQLALDGLAAAAAFRAEGCRVAIAARGQAGLEAAHAGLGDISTHRADTADAAAASGLIEEVLARWERLDILVTCAGTGASVPPGAETPEEWQRMMAQNLFSATNLIGAAAPALARAAPASIVCVSSICGREALGAPVAYGAAKAALEATVKGLSRPLAKHGIRINAVAPGNILAPDGTWARKLAEDAGAVARMLAQEVPMGCLGRPEWIADAIAFLASPRAAFITGTTLVADGGQTRGH